MTWLELHQYISEIRPEEANSEVKIRDSYSDFVFYPCMGFSRFQYSDTEYIKENEPFLML